MLIKNIVFSGGNLKGLSFFGGIKYLKEKNLLNDLKHIAGTSVGAIVAFCLILEYNISDLEYLFSHLQLENFNNINSDTILHFFDNFGIDSGDKLFTIFKVLLKKKNIHEKTTMKQFYNIYKTKLTFVGCCLNTSKPVYFNVDNTPDIEILKALRISYCIPFLYKPIKMDNYFYVDGGLVDNYCIELFEDELEHTLGFSVSNPDDHSDNIDSFESYFKKVLTTKFFNSSMNKALKYSKNTVYILIPIKSMDWNMTSKQKIELIDCGYVTTKLFFKSLQV